ncbi:hypothetical protein [Bradyrhizobium sp. Mp27]|uniref:hypothetical protein n=1 Tax=Bradyrhizobium sp. Mp27 TaxID=3042157 RepID=UPI00248B8FFC|nr:hypothetical protein [Bradyrhizobium sp. Mp27]MDI2077440.1 hypothetical protein [Bradyrhizobium sp. Mp27]
MASSVALTPIGFGKRERAGACADGRLIDDLSCKLEAFIDPDILVTNRDLPWIRRRKSMGCRRGYVGIVAQAGRVVPEPVQRSLGAAATIDLFAISAVVAMWQIRSESGGGMKRLMNVADQMQKP